MDRLTVYMSSSLSLSLLTGKRHARRPIGPCDGRLLWEATTVTGADIASSPEWPLFAADVNDAYSGVNFSLI
jgi:hypothetical protein